LRYPIIQLRKPSRAFLLEERRREGKKEEGGALGKFPWVKKKRERFSIRGIFHDVI